MPCREQAAAPALPHPSLGCARGRVSQRPGPAPALAVVQELVGRCRAPAPAPIAVGPPVGVEERLDDAPGLLDRLLAGEERMVAAERGFEEDLVRGWALATLLGELGTLTRNTIVFSSGARITKIAVPTPLQRRAFDLIGVRVPTELKAM